MIPLKTRGKPHNIARTFVGKVSRDLGSLDNNTFYLNESLNEIPEFNFPLGFLSLSKKENTLQKDALGVYNILDLGHLDEGDIIAVNPSGMIRTLFRINSFNNSLFVTERCNSNCLMCSQPPKNRDDIFELYQINRRLIELIPKETIELGITGGEPTLMGDLFPELLSILKTRLPDTNIHILSNGRSFAWNDYVKDIADIDNEKIIFGIPLYSDFYRLHDYIVQSKNAFNQTISGLYNLARFGIRIEIRVVLHKLSIPRLVSLAKYIVKNLPFVEHIALMGLEHTGYTPYNIDKLWIDPYDYQRELEEAVDILNIHNVNVSIYNHQLCVIPKHVRSFSQKSISAWKNDYLPECDTCSLKTECGGFFTSSLKKYSSHIQPFN